MALKQRGYDVGLLDMDFGAPDVDVIMGLQGQKPEIAAGRVIKPVVASNGVKVFGWGMVWPAMSAVEVEDSAIDSDDLQEAIRLIEGGKNEQAVKWLRWLIANPGGATYYMEHLLNDGNIDWGSIDFLVLDTPPETSGIVKALIKHSLDGGIIVTHPSSVSLADVTRTVDLMIKHAVPVYGIVSNQGKNEGEFTDRYDRTDEDVERFAKDNKLPFIGAIPHCHDSGSLLIQIGTIADFVVNYNPVILKRETKPSMKGDVMKFAKLLGALRK